MRKVLVVLTVFHFCPSAAFEAGAAVEHIVRRQQVRQLAEVRRAIDGGECAAEAEHIVRFHQTDEIERPQVQFLYFLAAEEHIAHVHHSGRVQVVEVGELGELFKPAEPA